MLKHKAVRSITLPMWYFCDLQQKAQKPAGFARTRPAPGKACRALTKPTTCSQDGRQPPAPRRCAMSPTRQIRKKTRRPPSVAGDLSPRARAAPDASRARSTGDRCIRRQPPAGAKKVPDGHRRRPPAAFRLAGEVRRRAPSIAGPRRASQAPRGSPPADDGSGRVARDV